MRELTTVDLFSGIGGFGLASGWAGFETLQFVERDSFRQKVLRKHWKDTPIHGDIYTFDGKPFRGRCDLVTGGFPCQPFSDAGQKRGSADDRYLWPQMLRVITEIRPAWVCCENVDGIIGVELDRVLSELEKEGYECQPMLIPACGVNAPHRRYRVWIIGYSSEGRQCRDAWRRTGEKSVLRLLPIEQGTTADMQETECKCNSLRSWEGWSGDPDHPVNLAHSDEARQLQCSGIICQQRERISNDIEGITAHSQEDEGRRILQRRVFPVAGTVHQSEVEPVADPDRKGLAVGVGKHGDDGEECKTALGSGWNEHWFHALARIRGVHDGVPRRLDRNRRKRIESLGDTIVPQVAYQILKAIAQTYEA